MRKVGHIEKGVMFGREDYLFLLDGGHHVFDLLLGIRKISEESYSNFEYNLVRRAAVCERAGAAFLHVIFPDKQSVMVDQFPVKDAICLTETYLDRLPHVRQWVCYPRTVLKDVTGGAFMKTDTHLSDIGTIVATAAVVERLIGHSQAEHVSSLLNSPDWHEKEYAGDLGRRFEPQFSERQLRLKKLWPHTWFHNGLHGGNNGIVDLLFSPRSIYDKRVLVYGDSFARDLSGFLSYFFREVVFLRTAYFHDDVFHQIQPDMVITSNVERYLDSCTSDDLRPSFFLYPYINGLDYAPDKPFSEAFSASLSYGRPPYWDFIKNIGLPVIRRDA